MEYSTRLLSAARLQWGAFCKVQDAWPGDQYMSMLHDYAARGARVVAARDGRRIVATMMFLPAFEMPRLAATDGLPEAVERAGLDAGKILIRSNIFVAPDQRGKGISTGLDLHCRTAARAEGFTHSLGIFYENPEIQSWALRRKDKIAAGINDENGAPVFFLPLG